MLRTFEKGFHLFRTSHHPDKESPKFRGELSSICEWDECACKFDGRGWLTEPTSTAITTLAPMENMVDT